MNFGDVDFRSFITINGITGSSGKVIGYDGSGNLQFFNRGVAEGGGAGATGPSGIYGAIGQTYGTFRTQILNGTLGASAGDLLSIGTTGLSDRFSMTNLQRK
jgi:hypothetical protein